MSHDCSCHGTEDRLATTVIGQIERPLYAPGLILQDSDLTAAVDYTRVSAACCSGPCSDAASSADCASASARIAD
jgi:hypothetical protein